MSGQRKQPQIKAAPVKESQPPVCENCKRVEVDSADRLFCTFRLPAYLRGVEDRRFRQVRHDDTCDFHMK